MSEVQPPEKKLPKIIWHLGWISFFADVSSEMVYPIVPLFVTTVLGAPVAALGLIEGLAAALVSVMKGLSGFHLDATGKKTPYIRWGYGLSAVGKPLMAFASVWPGVLAARLTDRFGKGIRTTARDTLIAESVHPSLYGRAYGLHGGLDTAGAFVGVLVALGLMWAMPGEYRTMFLIAGVPGLLSFLLTLKVKEPVREASESWAGWSWSSVRELPRRYWGTMAVVLLFGLGNSSDTLILLRAQGVGFTAMETIGLYGLYNLVFTVISYPAGRLSDRIGRWWLLGLGWLLYAGVYWGLSVGAKGSIVGLFVLYGVYVGITTGVTKALIADVVPKQRKGSAMGLFHMLSGFATLVASGVAGLLWDMRGPQAAFQFGAVAAGASAVSALAMALRGRRSVSS